MQRGEVDAMTTATMLQKEEFQFAKEMEAYVKELKALRKQNGEEEYRQEALEALRRTGVVTAKGNKRKKLYLGNRSTCIENYQI